MAVRPGGQLSNRPLHFFWLADCSGSMSVSGKMQSLNNAIREAIPHMQKVADENPNAQVYVRAIKFSSGAFWHIEQPTKVEDFKWYDLQANGVTDLGHALKMLSKELEMPPMPERALPPVIVLVSDGQPTDDFESGLQEFLSKNWAKKAVKIAIGIGDDADYDVLKKFMGNNEVEPLKANNSEDLVNYIRWVSTAILKASSAPSSTTSANGSSNNIPIPQPPAPDPNISATSVW